MRCAESTEFAVLVGIDWADRKHDVCVQAVGSDQFKHRVIEHSVVAINSWVAELRKEYPNEKIAVCLELEKGPLVSVLLKFEFVVIFPVNPSLLAKYREAWVPSKAKDDPTDAAFALELLRDHGDKLTRLRPQSASVRALQQFVQIRRRLVDDKTRLTNRITDSLKQYYPQPVDWFGDKGTKLFCDFVERWPSATQARRARRDTLDSFFRKHNVRGRARVEKRITQIKGALPLTEDAGVVAPAQALVLASVRQLRLLLTEIAGFDAQIKELCDNELKEDYSLFTSFPGSATKIAPRLVAAFGEDRERFQSAAEPQRAFGIAPVTERSGKKHWVRWRYQCSTFSRQTLVEWAGQTISRSFWASAFYHRQRSRGATHQAAVRTLAYKWLRIMYRCWKDRTPYDENRYLMALRKKGSSLLIAAASTSNQT